MKDIAKLKELVLKKVSLSDVLKSYGIHFMYNPDLVDEVQYRCNIHGDDKKPSARYYRSTQTCYCWACQKRWDAITFTRDKEGISYKEAILFLIKKYKIDTSSIPDSPELKPLRPLSPDQEKLKILHEKALIISLRGKIRELRRKIPYEKYIILCSAYFGILFNRFKGMEFLQDLKKLEAKIKEIKYV